MKSKFYLKTTHCFNRYQWALFHQYWDIEDWQQIEFSDYSKLSAKKSGKAIIRRYRNDILPMIYLN